MAELELFETTGELDRSAKYVSVPTGKMWAWQSEEESPTGHQGWCEIPRTDAHWNEIWKGNFPMVRQPESEDRTTTITPDSTWQPIGFIHDDSQVFTAAVGTPPSGFTVKDSGVREEYANGFVRDTEDGKPDLSAAIALLYRNPAILDIITRPGFDLLPKTALVRWADHMEKGAQKYGRDNWTQARGPVAVGRFVRSLCRHVAQYVTGDRTEDHAAAICFNVWAAEMTPPNEEKPHDQ